VYGSPFANEDGRADGVHAQTRQYMKATVLAAATTLLGNCTYEFNEFVSINRRNSLDLSRDFVGG